MKSQAEVEEALKLVQPKGAISPQILSLISTLEWVLEMDTTGAALLQRALSGEEQMAGAERSFAE